MPRALTLRPSRRRGAALLLGLAVLLDVMIFAAVGYANLTKDHVRVRIVVEHEIVQVFVNCQLVRGAYTGDPQGPAWLDLGWLDPGDILTLQVRGRKLPGYYELSLEHDSSFERVAAAGGYGRPLRLPSGRVIFARSYTAGGRAIGELGCQSDAPAPLPFAASAAKSYGRWGGGSGAALELATRLFPIVPWVLALIGAMGLIIATILGRVQRDDARRKTMLRTAFATVDIVLALVWALATADFNLAFLLCIVAGVGSLLLVLTWLLAEDLRKVSSLLANRYA